MTHSADKFSSDAGNVDIMESALCVLGVPDNQKDTVRGWIEEVATALTEDAKKQKMAPRLADIKTRLPKAIKQAQELADFIKHHLPYVRRVAAGYDLEASRVDRARGETGIPKVLGFNEQALEDALAEFVEAMEPLSKSWPADSGGDVNLFKMFQGSPKQAFAVKCWELFTWFRRERVRGKAAEDYREFVDYVYELATGKTPEDDHAGLGNYTKVAIRECNAFATSNPHFERLRRSMAVGETPVGLIEGIGWLSARIFGAPNRLSDRIMGRSDQT